MSEIRVTFCCHACFGLECAGPLRLAAGQETGLCFPAQSPADFRTCSFRQIRDTV